MDGDIKPCGEGQQVAGAGWTPHSIGNGRMGVDELGIKPVRIRTICATSRGGCDKSPKNRLGVKVPSLKFRAWCGRYQRRWGLKGSPGAKRGWVPRPPRTRYSPEDNNQLVKYMVADQ
jgi:hypothetical protein